MIQFSRSDRYAKDDYIRSAAAEVAALQSGGT